MRGIAARVVVALTLLAYVKAFMPSGPGVMTANEAKRFVLYRQAVSLPLENRKIAMNVSTADLGHWWPDSRGLRNRTRLFKPPPSDLKGSLKWRWQPPEGKFRAVIAGGPLIDYQKNIYVAAGDGLRKFDKYGKVLWYNPAYGTITHAPALMGNSILTVHSDGNLVASDIYDGHTMWSRRYSRESPEGMYPAGADGKWIYGSQPGLDPRRPGGHKLVAALNAQTGDPEWTLRTLKPVMNFAPIFPGDGTFVLMDTIGTVYRVNLTDGKKVWESRPVGNHRSFTEGGAILGPDGVVYACSNPGTSFGLEGELGVARAFEIENGTMLWETTLPHPCNTRPTMSNEGLSLVVMGGARMQRSDLHGSVLALDAKTGHVQWRYQAPRLGGAPTGAIDLGRREKSEFDQQCKPSHWSTPRIASDGSVWAARADGKLYNVRSPALNPNASSAALALSASSSDSALDADFQTTAGVEVHQTDVRGAPNPGSMAFAPGIVAVTTCDTLSVFKYR